MKLLMFGATGQVAQALQSRVASLDVSLTATRRSDADLAEPETCAEIIRQSDADIIINAAGYTAVDRAEEDGAMAMLINGTAPGVMAQAAAARGLPFFHISTDYVFDGAGTMPWREDMSPAPLSLYGQSKLAGEQAVQAAGGAHVILRTAWVFSAHGSNFVKTMLKAARTRDSLNVVADQHGGPTPAAEVAIALLCMARQLHIGKGHSGLFHFCGAPDTSWASFADKIFELAVLPVRPTVHHIPSSEYPMPAARPQNSRLDCSKIKSLYGVAQPDWETGLAQVIAELKSRI